MQLNRLAFVLPLATAREDVFKMLFFLCPQRVMEKAKAYIKSELGVAKLPSPPSDKPPPASVQNNTASADNEERVCFVCGVVGFGDQYRVRVKPDAQVRIQGPLVFKGKILLVTTYYCTWTKALFPQCRFVSRSHHLGRKLRTLSYISWIFDGRSRPTSEHQSIWLIDLIIKLDKIQTVAHCMPKLLTVVCLSHIIHYG